MGRPATLFTGQWADLPLDTLCQKASSFGFDGLELACWGDHFELPKADERYCQDRKDLLAKYGLNICAISNHLVGQAVCDRIDERHRTILPAYIWGDGKPDGIYRRAAADMVAAARAAKMLGVSTVVGFTGSPIWHLIYPFPTPIPAMIDDGFAEVVSRWKPILDEFQKLDVRFALEVHPTEIAFDIASAERTLKALEYHPAFGFNYDPSHLGYQGVDYVRFIDNFHDRIFHVHMKDVWWSDTPTDAGVFGGYAAHGDYRRYWDFRSPGRGKIKFEEIIRALNRINYNGPLSVEWEDTGMQREQGAAEACRFVRNIDFDPSGEAFDSAFKR